MSPDHARSIANRIKLMAAERDAMQLAERALEINKPHEGRSGGR